MAKTILKVNESDVDDIMLLLLWEKENREWRHLKQADFSQGTRATSKVPPCAPWVMDFEPKWQASPSRVSPCSI